MEKHIFGKQWQRLVRNLELGSIKPEFMGARRDEAWGFFKNYDGEWFERAVTACLADPGRRFFPSIGEIHQYLDDTAPSVDTMDPETRAILADPERRKQLQEENRKWWDEEVLPIIKGNFKIDG